MGKKGVQSNAGEKTTKGQGAVSGASGGASKRGLPGRSRAVPKVGICGRGATFTTRGREATQRESSATPRPQVGLGFAANKLKADTAGPTRGTALKISALGEGASVSKGDGGGDADSPGSGGGGEKKRQKTRHRRASNITSISAPVPMPAPAPISIPTTPNPKKRKRLMKSGDGGSGEEGRKDEKEKGDLKGQGAGKGVQRGKSIW